MLELVNTAIWILGSCAAAAALVAAVRARAYRLYFTLFLYCALSVLVATARFLTYYTFGYSSNEYLYLYYYSDTILTVFLYFAVMELYTKVFHEMGVNVHLRVGALLLLGGTALISYRIVSEANHAQLLGPFVVELQRNLYFVGVLLTYFLWGAVVKMRETRTRLIQLILGLGVFFSGLAANFALRQLFPASSVIWMYVPPLLDMCLAMAWAYTFWRVPEEARLAPARVVAGHH